jgi:chemotaxis protein CheC
MYLTLEQEDALSELINIGFGQAAATLSVLVGQRILLEAPKVELFTLPEFSMAFIPVSRGNEVIVNQSYQGPWSGNILLYINESSAISLVDLLNGQQGEFHPISQSDREALLEFGNILLTSYLGSFANLLNTRLLFGVPELCNESIHDLINGFEVMEGEKPLTLLAKTEFHFTQRSIEGYVILVIWMNTLEELLEEINKLSNF